MVNKDDQKLDWKRTDTTDRTTFLADAVGNETAL